MIIPAIDLKDGHSVRLYQGDYAKQMLVAQVPEEQAKAIDEAGLNDLHLVDLDGAKAKHPVNTETVRKIRRNFEGYIELGGGIRTLEDISACLEIGIDRVILGSVAVTDPELVKNALQKFGEEKIAIGIDGTNDKVAVNGWLEKTEVTLEELMKEMEAIGAKYFIVTDTSKDGTLAGPNIDLYRNLKKEFPNVVITASGGISGLADIKKLLFCGVREIIVGKALAAGRVTLEELSEVNRHAR